MSLAAAPELARIPAGEFLMGSSDAEFDERPVHRVHVSEFLISRFAVTQGEYARFVDQTGHPPPDLRNLPLITSGGLESMFKDLAAPYLWQEGRPPSGRERHPVVLITYEDALAYCRWLSRVVGRPVRLPTEAEWERAARGGLETHKFPWGDEIGPEHANFLADPASKRNGGTRQVGAFPPNDYGLFDMAGNTWEWVADWYGADYYATSESRDPVGPPQGVFRIVRGGSWVNDDVEMLRCAYRHKVPPDTYAYSIGFRIVCIE
jgi:formylglycine-generating enzyme required for sulfatase activity